MRTEQQVLAQILAFAHAQEDIRAVVLNGSRANPTVRRDLFCDYDVVCYAANPRRFVEDQRWIALFGDLIMLQQNEFLSHGAEKFIFLMLFSDGVRIDLSFDVLANRAYVGEDTLAVVLLDQDECIPTLPPSSDRGYHPSRPSPRAFADAINEIFWCANNVAKGLWRGELPYVKFMLDSVVRKSVLQVLAWYAADLHGWQVDPGKFGKWLKEYLPAGIWDSYVKTYAGAGDEENWEALLETLRLMRQVGTALAASLGYAYPLEDDQRMTAYLLRVRALPADAVSYDD